MSDLRTAAQQALEALEWHYRQGHSNTLGGFRLKIDEKALRELSAALAQQAEQRRATPVMQQALEILESDFTTVDGEFCRWCDGRLNAKHNCTLEQTITALKAALAQQAEPVEPVAWLIDYEDGEREVRFVAGTRGIQRTPLYTAPPQRKPLTEEEIEDIYLAWDVTPGRRVAGLVRAVERAHGIKE